MILAEAKKCCTALLNQTFPLAVLSHYRPRHCIPLMKRGFSVGSCLTKKGSLNTNFNSERNFADFSTRYSSLIQGKRRLEQKITSPRRRLVKTSAKFLSKYSESFVNTCYITNRHYIMSISNRHYIVLHHQQTLHRVTSSTDSDVTLYIFEGTGTPKCQAIITRVIFIASW